MQLKSFWMDILRAKKLYQKNERLYYSLNKVSVIPINNCVSQMFYMVLISKWIFQKNVIKLYKSWSQASRYKRRKMGLRRRTDVKLKSYLFEFFLPHFFPTYIHSTWSSFIHIELYRIKCIWKDDRIKN